MSPCARNAKPSPNLKRSIAEFIARGHVCRDQAFTSWENLRLVTSQKPLPHAADLLQTRLRNLNTFAFTAYRGIPATSSTANSGQTGAGSGGLATARSMPPVTAGSDFRPVPEWGEGGRMPGCARPVRRGRKGPQFCAVCAVCAVKHLNLFLSHGLRIRSKTPLCAVASPCCAVPAPRTLVRRAGHLHYRD